MKTSFGRALLAAGILCGCFPVLRAQDSAADNSAPPPSGYAPQQYVPLYGTAATTPPADPDVELLTAKPAPEPPAGPTFLPPSAVPRSENAPGSGSGFAPVVSGPVIPTPLVNPDGSLPRLYAPGFRVGPFDVRPDMTVTGTYNDNIYLVPDGFHRTSDYIVTVTPRVTMSYDTGSVMDPDATQFALTYIPSFLNFTQNTENSRFNQDADISFGHRFSKLRIYAEQGYSHVSGGVIQAGDLVEHENFHSFLDLSYAFTPKIGAELASVYTIDRYSNGIGSNEFAAPLYLNYEVRPKLTLSIAPYVDYLKAQGTTNDQFAYGGMARAHYYYSDRSDAYVQVGGGQRQYAISVLSNTEWNYALGIRWQAAVKTSVELSASRSTKSSVTSADSDYVDSSTGITVQQSLLDHFTAVLSGSYDHADYFSVFTNEQQQTYDYFSIVPALIYHPSIWADVGLSYTYRQSISTVKSSEFNNNQINIFSTVRF